MRVTSAALLSFSRDRPAAFSGFSRSTGRLFFGDHRVALQRRRRFVKPNAKRGCAVLRPDPT
jgi:hypothetical protein